MAVSLDSVNIEHFLNSVWTDITSTGRGSVASTKFGYGIRESGPNARVAATGLAEYTLNNINPATGAVGYYSPGHANARAFFGLGNLVRISLTYSGTKRYKFFGSVDDVAPEPGKGSYASVVKLVDWMDDAQKFEIRGVPATRGVRVDQVLTSILAVTPTQPNSTSFGVGSDNLLLAPVAGASEAYSAMSEFQRLLVSDQGFLVIRHGGTVAANIGRLTYIPRTALYDSPYNASQYTLNKTQALPVSRARKNALNIFRVTWHARTQDPDSGDPVVLYTLQGAPSIDPGKTLSWVARYTDPNQKASRVSGFNMVAPVNGTDIKLNSNPDGGGTDLYANFTVSVTYDSSGVFYSLTNNGAVTGFVALLQARGYGVYDYEPNTVEVRDAASVTANGENPVSIDLAYQTDPSFAQNLADYLIAYYKDSETLALSATFYANDSDAAMLAALTIEPGDVVTVQEDTTGVNRLYRVASVDFEVIEKQVWCTWGLLRMVDVTDYWKLEEGGSQLGTNTRIPL